MKSLLQEEGYTEIKKRMDQLSENSERVWGKMTPGQMVAHCQAPIEVMLGINSHGLKPNWLAKTFFKKAMYNDKPWRKNLPTVRSMKQTEDKDFTQEKAKLMLLIDDLYAKRDQQEWQEHPSFGYFTADQWGKMQYKHLDHHLRQFQV